MIQVDFNAQKLNSEIEKLKDSELRKKMISDYKELKSKLTGDQIFEKVAKRLLEDH